MAVRSADDLVREVDGEVETGVGVLEEEGDLLLGEDDREGTVLVHVVVEAEEKERESVEERGEEWKRGKKRTCRQRRKR